MSSSLDIMQQYSNTGRKVGVGWSISLYPTLFLVIPWKEKMHLVHSKPYCVIKEELYRSCLLYTSDAADDRYVV